MAVFVDYSLAPDARTGQRAPLVVPRPARARQRITSATHDELVRIVAELQDYIFDLLLLATQLPFGGPMTYLKSVPFTAATALTLPHYFTIAPAGVGAPSIGPARAITPAQIRFFVGQQSAPARFQYVSADQRNIVLQADANVTADVLLMVTP